jgi:hypothetical protein
MSRMLLFMHHIALCTSCIADFNPGHLYAYTGRSRGVGIGIGISSGASPMGDRRSTCIKL